MKKLEVGVIGLGKFGSAVAEAVSDKGHVVVGIDNSGSSIKKSKDLLRHVYQADATDIEALKQLRLMDLDKIVVSVGTSMEDAILIVLNLQELGIYNMAVKACTAEHASVLQRLGVKHVIRPELDAADILAHRIANPGLLDVIPIGGDVLLQELEVDAWSGRSLRELELFEQGVMVVAIKGRDTSKYHVVPDAERILVTGDILIAVGREKDVLELIP